jgi:hypothetical protein
MSQKFLSSIDLTKNELQNARIQNLATAPSTPVSGQIYFDTTDNAFKYYNGTVWVAVKDGDITSVVAGNGLVGGGASGDVTLDINTDNSTLEVIGDLLRVKPSGITANELNATGVAAGSYGSTTEIPVVTVDANGRITSVSIAAVSSDLGIAGDTGTDTVSLLTDTLTVSGTPNEIETVVTDNTITIGLPDDVTIGNNLIVSGNLTVSGSTTTVNTETILLADNILTLNSNETGTPSQNAGIEVERGTTANITLRWNETTDKWEIETAPTVFDNIATEGFVASSASANSYAVTITDTATVTHGLNSNDVIIQLYDTVTNETVFSDAVRASVNTATITFVSTPTNSIRVLVTKIG